MNDSLEALVREHGDLLLLLREELGSWEAVGEKIGADLDELEREQ